MKTESLLLIMLTNMLKRKTIFLKNIFVNSAILIRVVINIYLIILIHRFIITNIKL